MLSAEADAYFQDDTNFGSAPELLVKDASASFYREAYLRFDVSSLSSGVSSAVVKLHSLALDKEAGSYQAELVADNTWGEDQSPVRITLKAQWCLARGVLAMI